MYERIPWERCLWLDGKSPAGRNGMHRLWTSRVVASDWIAVCKLNLVPKSELCSRVPGPKQTHELSDRQMGCWRSAFPQDIATLALVDQALLHIGGPLPRAAAWLRPAPLHPAPPSPLRRIIPAATRPHRFRRPIPLRPHQRAGPAEAADQLHSLQPLDLVAEPRGLLELQVRRRHPHPLFQIRDRRFQVLADKLCRVGILDRRDGDVILLEHALQHLADLPADRNRRDPVRLVPARCLFRRRSVSSIADRNDRVIISAYSTTLPSTFRAARPIVWISDVCDRRNPSLSASKIATNAHSGISSPSRNRLIPTSTSNTPSRRSRMISIRSSVSMSECRYRTLTPCSVR